MQNVFPLEYGILVENICVISLQVGRQIAIWHDLLLFFQNTTSIGF